jgi:hypothetical protein
MFYMIPLWTYEVMRTLVRRTNSRVWLAFVLFLQSESASISRFLITFPFIVDAAPDEQWRPVPPN